LSYDSRSNFDPIDDATSYSRTVDKAEKISRNADGHFSAVSLQRRFDAPSSILLLSLSSHVFVCARTFVLSPSVTPCSFRCPCDSSRQLLVIYLQHGPRGAPGRASPSGPRTSRVPTGSGTFWRTMSRTRLQGILLLIDIIDFFFFLCLSLSLSLSSLTHFTGSACLFVLSPFSLFLLHLILGSHEKPVARDRHRRPLSNFRILWKISFALCALTALRKEFTYKYK